MGDVLKLVAVDADKVICSVNVSGAREAAESAIWSVTDAFVTVMRADDVLGGRSIWVTKSDGSKSHLNTRHADPQTALEAFEMLKDVEDVVEHEGMSLNGRSLNSVRTAEVYVPRGDFGEGRAWWGRMLDEFGVASARGPLGGALEVSAETAMGRLCAWYGVGFEAESLGYRDGGLSGSDGRWVADVIDGRPPFQERLACRGARSADDLVCGYSRQDIIDWCDDHGVKATEGFVDAFAAKLRETFEWMMGEGCLIDLGIVADEVEAAREPAPRGEAR